MILAGKVPLFLAYLMLCIHQSASNYTCTCIPSSEFYPYGTDEGDLMVTPGLDVSSPPTVISPPFPYYGASYSDIYVSSNGVLSFTAPFTDPFVSPLPDSDGIPLIAPYWADADIRSGGAIFYRATDDPYLLECASNTINLKEKKARFSATWMFVATWNEIPFYDADATGLQKRNTFQCVLVTDGSKSFAFFKYKKIEWTTSVLGGGGSSTGLGGDPAVVGFDAGDSINSFEIPESGTDDVLSVPNLTNVGIEGLFIFRIDEEEIVGEIDLDECKCYPCEFGKCENMVNGFTCSCFPGYTGELCDVEINECESSPCVNGVCEDLVNGYYCDCEEDFIGRNCDKDINRCRSSPCEAYSICINFPNSFKCISPHYG